jgi:hypothetical protein
LLKLTDGQFENARIKDQNAKLRNPDLVGMLVLIVVLFQRDQLVLNPLGDSRGSDEPFEPQLFIRQVLIELLLSF